MAPVASATSDDEGVVATSVAGRGGVMVRAWHVCPLVHHVRARHYGRDALPRARRPLRAQKKGKPRVCGLPLWTRPTRPIVLDDALGDLALQAEGREAKGEKSRRRGLRNRPEGRPVARICYDRRLILPLEGDAGG